ncbi:putative protein kinase RLK-Pelle-CrRLK1L-1 family [Helianthus debilis subsp. tardiflorus]
MLCQGYHQFITELVTLLKYNHENIIGLVGYCNETNENIIVYEHAYNGRLNKHLNNHSLTWIKRLKICINVANGLEFLHVGGSEKEEPVTHRDIKSGSILLDSDWNAKISNFEFSCKVTVFSKAEHVNDNACNSLGYVDPGFHSSFYLTQSSDIYSLGVILIEMLCGRLAWAEGCENHSQSLGPLAVRHYKERGNLDEMIFEGIMGQIAPKSLTAFVDIALKCLEYDWKDRPAASDVVSQLKMTLKFQVSFHTFILSLASYFYYICTEIFICIKEI